MFAVQIITWAPDIGLRRGNMRWKAKRHSYKFCVEWKSCFEVQKFLIIRWSFRLHVDSNKFGPNFCFWSMTFGFHFFSFYLLNSNQKWMVIDCIQYCSRKYWEVWHICNGELRTKDQSTVHVSTNTLRFYNFNPNSFPFQYSFYMSCMLNSSYMECCWFNSIGLYFLDLFRILALLYR
jgi:hypothetical protein